MKVASRQPVIRDPIRLYLRLPISGIGHAKQDRRVWLHSAVSSRGSAKPVPVDLPSLFLLNSDCRCRCRCRCSLLPETECSRHIPVDYFEISTTVLISISSMDSYPLLIRKIVSSLDRIARTCIMQIPTAGLAAKRPDSREHSLTQLQGQATSNARPRLFLTYLVLLCRDPCQEYTGRDCISSMESSSMELFKTEHSYTPKEKSFKSKVQFISLIKVR